MIFDPFLTLGYVEMIKVFLHPVNAVPYYLLLAVILRKLRSRSRKLTRNTEILTSDW